MRPLPFASTVRALAAVAFVPLAVAAHAQMFEGRYGCTASTALFSTIDKIDGSPDPLDGGTGRRNAFHYVAGREVRGEHGEIHYSAGAQAHANLDAGTIGASSYATTHTQYGSGNTGFSAASLASMWDTVDLSSDGRAFSGDVPIQLELDGFVSNANDYGRSWADVSLRIMDAGGRDLLVYENDDWLTSGFTLNKTLKLPKLNDGFGYTRLKIGFTIGTRSSVRDYLDGQTDTTANFFNTLHFRWDLPEGTTRAFASGRTDFAGTQPVPEPASFIALGIGALGLLKRRRKAA